MCSGFPRGVKTHKIVGILQVAQPISWVSDALSRLVRQLVLASAIGILLGALASLLMELSTTEVKKRLATWKAPKPRYTTGVFAKYARLVSTASEGAVTS